jgi:hypothetical protein
MFTKIINEVLAGLSLLVCGAWAAPSEYGLPTSPTL